MTTTNPGILILLDQDFNSLTSYAQDRFKQDLADLLAVNVTDLSGITFKEQEGTGKTIVSVPYQYYCGG